MSRAGLAVALLLLGQGVAAQEQPEDGAPLSAIDWLSRSVAPLPETPGAGATEPPVADSAAAPQVTVQPLDANPPDAVGLVAPRISGLPRGLWSQSEQDQLAALIAAQKLDSLPAVEQLLRLLMIAETDPPRDADARGTLFLARIDRLLEMGALEPAAEMLAEAGPDEPERFRRWFDTALLTGEENRACRAMRNKPTIAPTMLARIFCLAREGDWQAAALTLNSARALGEITDLEDAMLSRFLDPDLYEGEPPLEAPERVTPLVYRLLEAVGEAMPASALPRAFSQADLRPTKAWRAQLEAAERLARHGAIEPARLIGIYTDRVPAASGGVWDRAKAVQALDTALRDNAADKVAAALPEAWEAMREARLEVPFAQHYGTDLAALDLEDDAADLVFEIGLLGPDYEAAAQARTPRDPREELLVALARGVPDDARPETDPEEPIALAVLSGFTEAEPSQPLLDMIDEGRVGEVILRAISLIDEGQAGDTGALAEGLATLRMVGLEDQARRIALQSLLLGRHG
ncbi:hypothetical protein T8T21_05180 [Limimaricola variabilis]|uniref:hypothetical protein n=1 Tax=Limimaricola variabilis TaxID=1492771 RepID=UPI002AC8D6E2|nr:hypothetical protein [Limimaricola variabilis]WPY95518.1 hypothetical protein T8T21_05180 [Limimaricola variabilis]